MIDVNPLNDPGRKWLIALVLSLLLVSACDSSSPNEVEVESGPIELRDGWVTATPADVGLSPSALSGALAAATDINRLKSLLVVKDGKLIMEHYLHGAEPEDLHDVRSVTKSIVSTVMGIAIAEGHIPSINTEIGHHLDFLSEEIPDDIRAITIRDLLMMAGGWASDGYSEWINSPNTESFLMDKALLYPTGAVHSYSSAAVHLLSVLTAELVGQSFISYADSRLFHPLGIINREWEMFDSCYPNGGAGIDLSARDLAKIGQLFLQRGMSGDRQIIPGEWVDEASSPKFSFGFNHAGLANIGYGYLWWTDETFGVSSYFAWGYGGQFIYVSPARNLVVVITTTHDNSHHEFGGESEASRTALEVISRHILGVVSQE